MAVPKKKTSKSKRNTRRAHDGLKKTNLIECPNCGELKLPHHVCSACGYYNQKEVVKKAAAAK
jgi:large subunit ribosomal protein L32